MAFIETTQEYEAGLDQNLIRERRIDLQSLVLTDCESLTYQPKLPYGLTSQFSTTDK